MKKLIMTTAIILGLGFTTFAQDGMFHRANSGENATSLYESKGFTKDGIGGPNLPGHGGTDDADAPLGSGVAMLTALGGAYLVAKRRKED